MNAKKTLVSFLLVASVLFFAAFASAAQVTTSYTVEANDLLVSGGNVATTEAVLSAVAGETVEVKVKFTSAVDASNIKVKATLEGNEEEVKDTTGRFDVKVGQTYIKTLKLEVPSDFDEDDLSDNLALSIKVWNADHETEFSEITFGVQKPSYKVAVKPIVSNTFEAGQTASIDFMIENVGYNDLDDLFVTVKIPELNIEKIAYVEGLVAVESDDDDDDEKTTASGRVYLDIPYTAKAGEYTLVIESENEDTVSTEKRAIAITNSIPDLAMKSGNDLVLINPTNQLKVYKVLYQTNEVSVILPAASTKSVPITVPTEGDYSFDVSVFSGDALLSTVKFEGSAESQLGVTNPVVVLTVILAIVFLVLLVALIVLITKKPQKTEEFGESYY